MTRMVLASASSGRLSVLRGAGVDPLVIVSGVDEDLLTATLGPDAGPEVTVCALARAKAEQVAQTLADSSSAAADCVVIGCDSMLYLDGQLRGKPATADIARDQWAAMAGRSGELYTGHCVLRLIDGTIRATETAAAVTTVHFGRPARDDLEAYLQTGEPLQVAGAFTLDGLGGWFIDGVDGDPSAVVGIGLPLVRSLLRRVGCSIANLWTANPVPASEITGSHRRR